jgi:hypothetical protein
MSKSIHFFGQSVFGQLISLINRSEIQKAIDQTQSDRNCKGFTSWDHLLSMVFCGVGNCQSLREVCAAFLGLKGKTEHLGMNRIPRRSTLSDANKKRPTLFFETVYYLLLERYREGITDSRFKNKFGKSLMIFDSTTISLFQSVLRCVGRKPQSGKAKGGIKVHTLINADEKVPQLIWYSNAATHDSRFYDKIEFLQSCLYVFDKGYIDFWRFDEFTKKGIQFCTRLRDNATYEVLEVLDVNYAANQGILKDEWIELPLRKNGKIHGHTRLRRIEYWDVEQNRLIVCLSNISEMQPLEITELYRCRWQIESLFKQLKQNFPLKYFLGDNENAITIQIWCTLIVNLLLTVVKQKIKRAWSFSNLVSFARLHLFNHIHLLNFLENPDKDWIRNRTGPAPNLTLDFL